LGVKGFVITNDHLFCSGENVQLVFAVREPTAERHLTGLTELVVPGLVDDEARTLLLSVITGPMDERVRNPPRRAV
jgi:hypothetical protein